MTDKPQSRTASAGVTPSDSDNGALLARVGRDLGPRLASGIALALAALGLTWAGLAPFAALVLGVSLLLAWEWGRVVRRHEADATLVVHGLAVVAAVALTWSGLPGLALLAVVVGTILAAILNFGASMRLSAIGVAYVTLPGIALVWLRRDPGLGLEAVLLLFLCVWGTDTVAYFAGRLLGGPKLWPRISPNKTWSGFIGGIGASALGGAIMALFVREASVGRLAVIGLVLGMIAQAGDLAESALKRGQGVKDASGLIPGHGGFLDRVDGLVTAAVAAALLALMIDVHAPARALLVGG